MDQGKVAGERAWQTLSASTTEYPTAYPGSGTPVQHVVFHSTEVPATRSRGYTSTGSVSSRPPVRRDNRSFGINLSGARPVTLAKPHSQAVSVPSVRAPP